MLGVRYSNAMSHSGWNMSHIEFGGDNTNYYDRLNAIELLKLFSVRASAYMLSSVTSWTMHESTNYSRSTLVELPKFLEATDPIMSILGWSKNDAIAGSKILKTDSSLDDVLNRIKITEINWIITVISERQITEKELKIIQSVWTIDKYLAVLNINFWNLEEKQIHSTSPSSLTEKLKK